MKSFFFLLHIAVIIVYSYLILFSFLFSKLSGFSHQELKGSGFSSYSYYTVVKNCFEISFLSCVLFISFNDLIYFTFFVVYSSSGSFQIFFQEFTLGIIYEVVHILLKVYSKGKMINDVFCRWEIIYEGNFLFCFLLK